MGSRPAGYSDEDSDDEFELSTSYDRIPRVPKVLVTTIDEKLISSIIKGNIDEVKKYLDEGADVNKPNKSDGWTPLMHACYMGHVEIVELLISKLADTTAHYQLLTPFLCIFDSDCTDEDKLVDCYNILIKHGADVTATDWYGSTPLMHASRHNHLKLAVKLLGLGCDIEDEDNDGWTAIFYAVDNSNINIVQLLIDSGANLYHEDRRGRTLAEIAFSKHNKDIYEIVSKDVTKLQLEESVPEIYTASNFQLMLKECPNKNDRLYGFSSDALKMIKGVGLRSLAHTFIEHDVQLGHLLTWDDAQWKKIGVDMSFDRRKLASCAQKYHEHGWSKESLNIQNQAFNQLTLIQQLCNMVRQLHILSLTSHYYLNNTKHSEKSDNSEKLNKKLLVNIKMIKKHLQYIKKYAQEMDRDDEVIPSDLITANMKKRSIFKTYIIPGILLVLIITQAPKLNVFKTK